MAAIRDILEFLRLNKFIIIALLLLPSSLYGSEWSKADTVLQSAFVCIALIDWGQTLEIVDNENYYETNTILGEHPGRSDVNIYFASFIVLHSVGSYIIPSEYRKYWQSFWIGFGLNNIRHNNAIGIKLNF